MVTARLPGWTWKDLGPDGGPYDVLYNPKVVVHTTEGSTLAGAESAYRNYPPHLGYDPIRRIKRQYVGLDRHSYALKGSESDDEFAVQVEVVGFANDTHNWSAQIYKNFAVDVVAPLEKHFGVPRIARRFYGADEGIVLASPHSPIRMSNAGWRSFSGWLGHQHAPAPDEHWDPGRFLIQKSFEYLAINDGDDDMTPREFLGYEVGTNFNDDFNTYANLPGTIGHFFLGLRTRTDETEPLLREVRDLLQEVKNKLDAS